MTHERLSEWLEHGEGCFLGEHDASRLQNLRTILARVAETEQRRELPLTVCFLGGSGVGKSTLLNALVAGSRRVVPQGGVGPLTAQATIVQYGEDQSFTATYFEKQKINQIVFTLERAIEHGDKKRASGAPPPAEGVNLVPPTSDDGEEEEPIDGYLRVARLLVRGHQFAQEMDREEELRYLADGLRAANGSTSMWNTVLNAPDAARVKRLGDVLAAVKAGKATVSWTARDDNFREELTNHASGALAPLIKSLSVTWPSDTLRNGIQLVDLPGVGIANDEYRHVTAKWVRSAKAVVLVVNARGVTEDSAKLLRSTGFLNNLLHQDADSLDAYRLLVAVVKLDEVASDKRREVKGRDGTAEKWSVYFDQACEEAVQLVRTQVGTELDKLLADGDDGTESARRRINQAVLNSLEVFPVCATEYAKLLEDDEEDRARLTSEEASRIPQMKSGLAQIARKQREFVDRQLQLQVDHFLNTAKAGLDLIAAQHDTSKEALSAATRARIEERIAPLVVELDSRRAQFGEFITAGILQTVDLEVMKAAADARRSIKIWLGRYENTHWATIRAAVRRHGRFSGAQDIDLPNELTLVFEQPVAVAWAERVLPKIQKRVDHLAERYEAAITRIASDARADGLDGHAAIIGAIQADLESKAGQISDIGSVEIARVREDVAAALYEAISVAVEKACTAFVNANKDSGTGVKKRLLDLLTDLADQVVDEALPAAKHILHAQLGETARKIGEALLPLGNPARSARDALLAQATDAATRDATHNASVRRQCHDALLTLSDCFAEKAQAAE